MRRTPRGIYLLDNRLWVGRGIRFRWMRGYAWCSLELLGGRVDIRWR